MQIIQNRRTFLAGLSSAGAASLVSQRAVGPIEAFVEVRSVGELSLKGFHRLMTAFEVIRWFE
jgi:hypothetical protein